MISASIMCQGCHRPFHLDGYEEPLFRHLGLPSPTFCPRCRLQKRLAFRNEYVFYERPCDLCRKTIMSVYAPDRDFKVFCPDCFYSKKWNPLDYGRPYDFKKTFFEQWLHLQRTIPHISMIDHPPAADFKNWFSSVAAQTEKKLLENPEIPKPATYMENSANSSGNIIKNSRGCDDCYVIENCENVKHGLFLKNVRASSDVTEARDSEFLYEIIGGSQIDHCYFSTEIFGGSSQVQYSHFLYDCHYCFGCVNLRGRSYCILNYEYGKKEYGDFVIRKYARIKTKNTPNLLPRVLQSIDERPFEDRNRRTCRYGDFFPPEFSPFGYNETLADVYFPAAKDVVERAGFSYSDSAVSQKLEPFGYENFIRDHLRMYKRRCYACNKDTDTVYLKSEVQHILCQQCYNEQNL